jgi:hypothetical protein
MDELNHVLVQFSFPPKTCRDLRMFFINARRKGESEAQKQLLAEMSPMLRASSASLMFGKKIRSVWYFKDVSDELVGTISLRLRTECYSTGEAFYTDGKLYIVNRGLILRNSMFKFSGSTWGEDFIFSKALRRPLKSIILAFAELMTLSQDAFYSILEDATQEDYDETRGKIVRLIVTRGIINEARRRLLEDPSLVSRITKSECDDPTKSILWRNVMAERQAAVQMEKINVRRNELKLLRTNTRVHGGGDSPPVVLPPLALQRKRSSMTSERGFGGNSRSSFSENFDIRTIIREELRTTVEPIAEKVDNISRRLDRLTAVYDKLEHKVTEMHVSV